MPMFDVWYYGRRIGATDAPTIYDERGHEHRALIRRLHHSAPDHEPPRWCGCPRRLLRARRPLWGSTMAASSASSGGTGASGPVWAAAASTAARKAAEGLESGQSASQALRPLSHCAPPTEPRYPNFGPLRRVRLRVSGVDSSVFWGVLGVLSKAGGSDPAEVATRVYATWPKNGGRCLFLRSTGCLS